MYKLVLTILFLSIGFTAFAQQGKYDASVDKKTYELFMKSNWGDLREVGNTAIENGIDFYYLRMRMGISYYQEKNYMSAVSHFEKAVVFSPKDSTALEYLYYSYLFSGQESEANILGKKLSASLRRKTGYTSPEFFKGIYTEGGYSYNNNYNSIKGNGIKGNQGIAGTQNVFKNETYINLSLMHSLGDRVSIFHGYNNIVVNSLRQYDEPIDGRKDFDVSVKQNEYYINLGIYLGKGYNLTTALHYLNVKLEDVLPPDLTNPLFTNYTTTTKEMVETFGITKRLGHTELGYSALLSNLNSGKQLQNTFTFIWYPLGNMNFYNVSNFIFHSNKSNDSSDNITRFIFDEKLGFKVSNKLWAEVVFTAGNLLNYSEGNAFIVYNTVDKIKYKAGFNLISPISKNLELSFRYLLLSQDYDVTSTNTSFITTTKTNNLLIHKLIGGIKWTF